MAPSFECRTVSQQEAVDIQRLLTKTLASCPRCDDSGWIFFRRRSDNQPDAIPCPCGGTDEDRIDPNDFEGAA
jgi:hypothetical protein